MSDTTEQPIELSIVMPCLNEAETVATCVKKARDYLKRSGVVGEVIVADNGSTDGSQKLAEDAGARVVAIPERGYGAALYGGSRAALGRYIIMGDADDSYDFSRLDAFVGKLREGFDVVMGNRFRGGIRPGAMPWKNRWIGNPILSTLGRVLFDIEVRDFHCGLRGYARAAFDKMDLQTTGMEFASEMVIKARLLDMRMTEVPTTLDKDGRTRPPHLLPWRDGWRHLRFMLLYSPRWVFLYPGLALVVVGVALNLLLIPGPVLVTRKVGIGVHSLLYASAAILVGFQAVAFSFIARIYARQTDLLPADPQLDGLFRYFSLEVGLLVGAGLFLGGFSGAAYLLWFWVHHRFTQLDVEATLRLVIPSVTALSLGAEVILVSMLLSFLGLSRRRRGPKQA